jgi:hypothetical protein
LASSSPSRFGAKGGIVPVSAAYDRWMVDHHGVITLANFAELGFTRRQAQRIIAAERLVPMAAGVYRSPAHRLGRLQLMVAACLRQPQAAIASTTAGQELGIRGMKDPHVRVLVPHGARLALPGVVAQLCRGIDPVDITTRRRDGVRLTSPPRTLVDAAAVVGLRSTVSAIEHVLHERRCTLNTLLNTANRLFHPRRQGSVVIRQALRSRAEWRGIARSDLELRVIEAIIARGLPLPEVNMRFVLTNGERIVIDLAWPQWRVAVEVDHPFWHDGVVEAARDKRRDRKLVMAGWQPVRLPELEIDHALDELLDDLAQILLSRGWPGPMVAI